MKSARARLSTRWTITGHRSKWKSNSTSRNFHSRLCHQAARPLMWWLLSRLSVSCPIWTSRTTSMQHSQTLTMSLVQLDSRKSAFHHTPLPKARRLWRRDSHSSARMGQSDQSQTRSLRNLSSGKSVASAHTAYRLKLCDIKGYILQRNAIPYLRIQAERGLVLLGLSGIGKTPFSRILSLAISEYNINCDTVEGASPGYRCGSDLDFFRLASGSNYAPASCSNFRWRPTQRWHFCTCGDLLGPIWGRTLTSCSLGVGEWCATMPVTKSRSHTMSRRSDHTMSRRSMLSLTKRSCACSGWLSRNRRHMRICKPFAKRQLLSCSARIGFTSACPRLLWRQGSRQWTIGRPCQSLTCSQKEGVAKLKSLRRGDATPSLTHFQDKARQMEFVRRNIYEEPIYLNHYIQRQYNGAGILEDTHPFDEKPHFAPLYEDDPASSPGFHLCGAELAIQWWRSKLWRRCVQLGWRCSCS